MRHYGGCSSTNLIQVSLSVDALSANLSGIGRYCWELARGLGNDERVDRLRYFVGRAWVKDPESLLQEGCKLRGNRSWRGATSHWWNRRQLAQSIVHAPNYFLPDWAECGISTIHDLSVFKYPNTHPLERIKVFEAGFSSTMARATLILTDCEWMRQEVMEYTGLGPHRVVAVPLGVGPEFHPRSTDALTEFTSRHGLTPGQYGLCVSTMEPRKRIGSLIAAWRMLPASLRAFYPLVLAGGAGWHNERLMVEIARGRSEGWLRYLGYVNKTDLPLLYAGARLFAYPSQYEGFGLPPLEAMASGVPAVVARGTCLEETAGPAAVLIDPDDVVGFTNLLEQLLTDDQQHARLSSFGIQHALQFSWKRCISGTVDAYQKVLQGHI